MRLVAAVSVCCGWCLLVILVSFLVYLPPDVPAVVPADVPPPHAESTKGRWMPSKGMYKVYRKLENNADYDASPDSAHDEIVPEDTGTEYDDYEDDNPNPSFKKGDFDPLPRSYKKTTTIPFPEPTSEDPISYYLPPNLDTSLPFDTVQRSNKLISNSYVEDNIVWAPYVENAIPRGLDDEDVGKVLKALRLNRIKSVEPPSWIKCGRPKNQYIKLEGGGEACARYRDPHNYLVQGEVMSFYLARLLGMDNVPPVVLTEAKGQQWSRPEVRKAIEKAGWRKPALVALIHWVEDLQRDRMPAPLLNAMRNNLTISVESGLSGLSRQVMVQLAQWSDMLVFDYLTGNYDRVASMQDAAEKEEQPNIMEETIHNLVKNEVSGGIWLIDNESGLVDGYALMYTTPQGRRFVQFHNKTLHTICIFRRTTIEAVSALHRHGMAHTLLLDFIRNNEPLFDKLPNVLENREFVGNFQRRVNDVHKWMKHCNEKVGQG